MPPRRARAERLSLLQCQRSADLKTWQNVTDAAQKDLGGGVLQITGKRTANAKAEFFRAGVQ